MTLSSPRAVPIGETLARGLYRALAQLPAEDRLVSRVMTPGGALTATIEDMAIPLDARAAMPGRLFKPPHASGASVLLVHGALTYALPPYAYFMEALLARGFSVLTVELDGHGANPRPFSAAGLAENVPAALRYLQGRADLDAARIGVLGFSLGGACALQALSAFPEVKALVTVAAPIAVGVETPQHLAEVAALVTPGGLALISAIAPRDLLSFLDTSFRVAEPDGQVRELHCFDHRTPLAVNRAVALLDPLGHAGRITAPYLQVHGEWDNIIPPAHAHALNARAGGPKAIAMSPLRNHFTIMGCPRAVSATAGWFERWV